MTPALVFLSVRWCQARAIVFSFLYCFSSHTAGLFYRQHRVHFFPFFIGNVVDEFFIPFVQYIQLLTPCSKMSTNERGTPPVFLPVRNLPPENDMSYTVREMCSAAEKVSGFNSIIGAQRIGGLWRLYPKSFDSRSTLLFSGLELRNHSVTLFDKNPFIVKTAQGAEEVKTTKVIIGNLPLSHNNEDIEKKLTQMRCELHSKMMMERDRDDRGGLTRWLTGRRFVYIQIPSQPLPERITIGTATATLYHREQKQTKENQMCSRCFRKGHLAATCQNDIVCRTCKNTGHASGHPSCPLPGEEQEPQEPQGDKTTPQQQNVSDPERAATTTTENAAPSAQPNTSIPKDKDNLNSAPTSTAKNNTKPTTSVTSPRKPRRNRPSGQTTLNFRGRSVSENRDKRPLSSPPPDDAITKAARNDNSRDDPSGSPSLSTHSQSEKVNT